MTLVVPGSVSAEALMTRHGLTGVIYGHPGVGKTLTAVGIEKAGPAHRSTVLVIDCEGGAGTIAGIPNVLVRRVTEAAEIEPLYRWLVKNARELDIGTVIIDTLTALQRMGLDTIVQTSKDPTMPDIRSYGKSNELIGKLARMFVALADAKVHPETGELYLGWNVLFICHVGDTKDESTGIVTYRPSLTPKAAEMVSGVVDLIGYVTVEPNTDRRVLVMDNWRNAIGKVRRPANRPAMPTKMLIPSPIQEDGTQNTTLVPTLARVLQHYRGDINLNERDKYPELFPRPTQPQP